MVAILGEQKLTFVSVSSPFSRVPVKAVIQLNTTPIAVQSICKEAKSTNHWCYNPIPLINHLYKKAYHRQRIILIKMEGRHNGKLYLLSMGIFLLSSHALKQVQRHHQRDRVLAGKSAKEGGVLDLINDDTNTKPLDLLPDRLRIGAEDLNELATTYEGGWIQDGVMFDVRTVIPTSDANSTAATPPSEGIVVLGLDILTPVVNEPLCVEIYSKDGGFEGFDSQSSAWTFLGSVSVVGQGKDTPTRIPIGSFDPQYIAPDSTRAYYVTTQDENLRYTAYSDNTTTTGTVFVSSEADANGMTVEVLTGVAKNYPFAQSWPDRMFNGAIVYSSGSNVDLDSILDETQAAEANAAKRGYVTCDAEVIVTPSPTVTPAVATNPTAAPIVSAVSIVTESPSEAPSLSPTTLAPTTLQSTIKKVATTLHGGLKQAGMMFDIRVPTVEEGGPDNGLTVLAFEISTFLTEEICVEVYSKEGTHVGFEEDVTQTGDGSWFSHSWSILGAATAIGQGEAAPTHLPIGSLDPTHISPGETRAFYVTMNVPEMRYTQPVFGEKTGDAFSSSSQGHLDLLVGSAKAYPFMDTWADRIFNGAVIYYLGTEDEAGKYSAITADQRMRSCPGGPTTSPIAAPDVTDPITNATDAVPTPSPIVTGETSNSTTIGNETGVTEGTESATEDAPRLADTCPAADTSVAKKEIAVDYKYAMITNSSADSSRAMLGLENVVHTELMANKCSGDITDAKRKLRRLQESITYLGFNSNPVDKVSAESCSDDFYAADEFCVIVQGGVSVLVPESADESSVQSDIASFVEGVVSDTQHHDAIGVKKAALLTSDSSTDGGLNFSGAEEEKDINGGDGLSTTAIAIIAVVAAAVMMTLVLLFVARRHKKTKRADGSEVFHEFPDEEPVAELGPEYGMERNNDGRSVAESTLFPPDDEESTVRPAPAMILNDHDEVSLISNDRSKFAPSAPESPGSNASKGSNNSRGSVEFVKAGQSFTSRSHQPEDTVDL